MKKFSLIIIISIFILNTKILSSGLWPIFFNDNQKFNLFAPFIQFSDNTTIFRPLFSYHKLLNDYEFNFLYPLVKFSKNKKRIFPIYNSDKNSSHFFPIFWGKKSKGLFPIYGELNYSKTKFFLWPIYTEKKDNHKKEISILWPFFGIYNNGFRFWPFFSIKNEEKFFLWPLFIFQKRKISEKNYEYKNLYFPFFIHTYSNNYDYKTFIFPFFRFNERNDGYRYYAFWPFIIYKKKDFSGKYYKFSFFPFYKKVYLKNYRKTSFFWILFQKEISFTDKKNFSTKYSFLLINRFENNYKNFWPFFEYYSSNNGYIFKFLELFPLKLLPVYELYSPFFNLFYISKNKNRKRISFFWGLFVYEKNQEYKKIKLFQFIKIKLKNKKYEKISFNRDILFNIF